MLETLNPGKMIYTIFFHIDVCVQEGISKQFKTYIYIHISVCVLYEYGSQLTIVVDSTLWTPVGFAVRLDMVAVVAIMTVERRMF